jgi:XRE family transcriptional regulator, stress-response regulator
VTRLRELIGATLRRRRLAQARTLRQVAVKAGISLTYLSEVERGRKEPSSEVLVAVCHALGLVLSDVLFEVAEAAAQEEAATRPANAVGFLPPARRLAPVPRAPRHAVGHPPDTGATGPRALHVVHRGA